MTRPQLVIADDSALMRRLIEVALSGRCEVVARVEDGAAAVSAARDLKPHLVLLDLSMPGLNGLEAARQIKKACPDISLLFVSEHDETSYREAAFEAGASGYVSKRKMFSELLPAIGEVLSGKQYGKLMA